MPRKQNITPDLYNRPLPTRLRQAMHDKGMTADALASIVGVTRQSIGYYQNGDRTPDAVTLGKIAKGLGVSADYLLGLDPVVDANNNTELFDRMYELSRALGVKPLEMFKFISGIVREIDSLERNK